MDLFYREYGDGPPLVLLHGFLGASGNWHTLARQAFAPRYRVLVPDQRNHGQSPHADGMDYASLSDDLIDFLDARGVDTAVVLGHSMGGNVAMHAALSHPERVSALVVADIAPRPYPESHRGILDAIEAIEPSGFERRADVDEALARHIDDAAVRQLIMKNLDRDPEGRFYWTINVAELSDGYADLMDGLDVWATYEGPSLFIRGSRSNYVGDADIETIRSYFPSADLETIEDAGHWLHADQPEAFSTAVLSWLDAQGA